MYALGLLLALAIIAGAEDRSNQSTIDYRTYVDSSSDFDDAQDLESLRLLPNALDIFDIDRIRRVILLNSTLVSKKCLTDMHHFFAGLRGSETWAMRILDANGMYSSAYLFGNKFWVGSQTECLDLPNHVGKPAPFPVTYYLAKFKVNHNVSTHHEVISLGLCMPYVCSNDDLSHILRTSSPSQAQLLNVRAVPDKNYNFFLETPLLILIAITSIVVIIVAVGTLYEIRLDRIKHRTLQSPKINRNKQIGHSSNNPSAKSEPGPLEFFKTEKAARSISMSSAESTSSVHSESSCGSQQHKPGTIGQIILCFSLKSNLKKICDTRGSDALGCVHGLRVASLLWVIAGHTCMITVPYVDNIGFRIVVERDFLFQSIGNGAFSVDTFFFLSGLLIAFVFSKSEKTRSEEQDALTHAKTTSVKLLGGVSYRYIRLTPPYIVVIIVTYLLGRWLLHNSIFDPPIGDMINCPNFWWRNLLYINTLFPVDQMCVIWSWYLADDTQFYVLGLIMLLLSTRYKKTAAVSTGLLLVLSWTTTAVITFYTNHKPSVDSPLGLFDQLYDKPWTRLGPYVVGMAVGIYLSKVNCQATFHKGAVAFGWFMSLSVTFVLVYGLYGELSQIQSAAYVTLSHTAWALALSWIVIACVTGYGGPINRILCAKGFAPLSRLTYCAYLIHPVIMISAVSHMDGPAHFQRDTMIITILGYFLASYLGSVVLTLLFEAPAVGLLNIFHPLKKKMK